MQPWFTLVTTFVFGPYVISTLAETPAQGQAAWGFAAGFAGLAIAFLSPPLGAIADAAGPRKPWIAGLGLIMMVCACSLWFAAPGAANALLLALVVYAIGTVAAEMAGVFNNAMMPSLVPPDRLGRLSAHGWASGYAAAIVTIVIAIGFMVAPADTGRTLFGLEPVFGLDPEAREGDRAVGPFTALWFAVLVLPLFTFTPDKPRSSLSGGQAVRQGLADLRAGLAALRRDPPLFRFLIAHMLYADGLVALFAFGGIYGTGVFGWSPVEVGLFGILLTITGTAGALIGGPLEDRVGAKPVVLTSLAVLTFASLCILSLTADRVFFVVPVEGGDGLYGALSEKLYLALGGLIGAAAGPLQASSRALLARLAPPQARARTFGLFALSGKVTSFVGPWAVATVTALTMDQRAGVSVLVVFFVTGAVVLMTVRSPRTAG
ncbi:MAG: MFS transporter [Devosiaceae bacterium]|nr:MFS transporter [Devosiaceae bacterium MH13]